MSDTTARIDLADYGRVRIEVALSGDVAADAQAITDALAAVNRATLDVISWADDDPADYRALADHLKDAWNGGPRAAVPATNGQSRPAPAQPASAQPRAPRQPTGLFCREHRVEVEKTPATYDKDGDRYQHDYPPGETGPQGGKRHMLYYRELVDSQGYTVDASGNNPPQTTGGPPPWQGGSQQPVATAAGTAPPGPPPPEPPPDERAF